MKKTIELLFILIGILAIGIGVINTFWGNDPLYGLFILVASLIYFPASNNWIQKWSPVTIANWMKLLLALFIFWSSLGVGELFEKLELMRQTFNL